MLYQIICLWDTPPVTSEEQKRCLHAANGCWRANHPANPQNGRNGHGNACAEEKEKGNGHCGQVSADGCPQEKRRRRSGRSKAHREEEQPQEA